MKELSLEQRLFILSEAIRLTEKAFAHWENALIDPDELSDLADEFFRKAASADNRVDFQFVMWEFFGRLRNGHSNYYDRAAPFPFGGMVHLSLTELVGAWVVAEDGSGLMQPGDELKTIAGRPIRDWLYELSRITGITDWRSMIGRFPYYFSHLYKENEVEVLIEDEQGSAKTIHIQRRPVDFEAQLLEETTGGWIALNEVAYIHIPSFNQPKYEARALELLEAFHNAPCLIIDVRGNGGGTTPDQLINALMNEPFRWWNEQARHPEFLRRRHPNADIQFEMDYRYAVYRSDYVTSSHENSYSGKLFILVDRFTGSAAEDFTMPFIDNGRATIIGERTFGSTGQPFIKSFDDGSITVMVGAIRTFFPNGDSFEGVGITPDVEVSNRREYLYQKRDIVLETALELAQRDI
ncbi:S41 family peptidase [Paenibacillus ihbetae]|uniref:Tail specific protease domain-containing protein n=1 Tax=Paenibacillus ihbetae TaxID=1870820 RepID=A0A1B2DU86_9BACL|nr:S41 family peptidase [Paenibacillus ihbetae]ANY71271.1 hypothetical protein BBD41_00970 [Paenibacillus ihbetae]OOC61366.1 hypothetical protein BBD40_05375 [Paenibacillus ihbetae]